MSASSETFYSITHPWIEKYHGKVTVSTATPDFNVAPINAISQCPNPIGCHLQLSIPAGERLRDDMVGSTSRVCPDVDKYSGAIDATCMPHEFGHYLNRIQADVSGNSIHGPAADFDLSDWILHRIPLENPQSQSVERSVARFLEFCMKLHFPLLINVRVGMIGPKSG